MSRSFLFRTSARYLVTSLASLLVASFFIYTVHESIENLVHLVFTGKLSIELLSSQIMTSGWNSWILRYSSVIPIGFQALFLTHIFMGIYFQSTNTIRRFGAMVFAKRLTTSLVSGLAIYTAPILASPFNSLLMKFRYSYGFLHFFRDDHSLHEKFKTRESTFSKIPKSLIVICGLCLFLKTLVVVDYPQYANHFNAYVIIPSMLAYLIYALKIKPAYPREDFFARTFLVLLCFTPALLIKIPADTVLISIFAFSYHVIIWYFYFLQKKWPINIAYLVAFIILNSMFLYFASQMIENEALTLIAGQSGDLWGSSYYVAEVTPLNSIVALTCDARFYHFWAVFHVTQSWFRS